MTKILFVTIVGVLCWKVAAAPGDTDKTVCDEIRVKAQDQCADVSVEAGEKQSCYTDWVDDLVSEYNDNTSDLLDDQLSCDYE